MINGNDSQTVKNMRNRTTRLEREGDYWTEDEKSQLKDLFEDGAGITEIAIHLQRTEPAVFQQAEKMDLYGRKRNPMRNRKPAAAAKSHSCLCDVCEIDRALCPRQEACMAFQEGA